MPLKITALKYYFYLDNFHTRTNKCTINILLLYVLWNLSFSDHKMIKALEWIAGGLLFLAFWLSLITKTIEVPSDCWCLQHVILYLPFYAVVMFGAVSAIIVFHRTLSFNDCPEASKELQEQIKAARTDLKKRGLKLK